MIYKTKYQQLVGFASLNASVTMFTEPKIITSSNLKIRSYVLFYYNGKRYREYNGKRLGLNVNPNHCSTAKDRDRLLRQLAYNFQKSLESGWNPLAIPDTLIIEKLPTHEALNRTLTEKLNSPLSLTYKRDLKKVTSQFLDFLTDTEREKELEKIPTKRVDEFLNQFASSGTHFMNKRRALGVIFSAAGRKGFIQSNVVKETQKRKAQAKLHSVYSPEKLKQILEFLKEHYPNLYLCSLLTYGCLLRPHEEVRLLKVSHFKNNFSEIHLSGSENKSGRVRVVHVPEYVRKELIDRVGKIKDVNHTIISCSEQPFNVSYFSLQWSRAKKKMKEENTLTILENETIYSIRHSAAVNIYKRFKDVHLLQQLLAHSSMVVTLKYLRGLGELNIEQLKDASPEL